MRYIKIIFSIFTIISTSISGLAAIFSDMVSIKPGALPGSSFFAGKQVIAFQIGKSEVTWAQWKTVRAWAVSQGYDISNVGQGNGDEHPVHSVSWYDAVKWLNAASQLDGLTPVYKVPGQVYKRGQTIPIIDSSADGYRLPTEIEWEWAARGGANSQSFTYSGSNVLADVGWYEANSTGAAVDMGQGHGTWPVRSKKPNELGLFDLSGNIAEWCWDADNANRSFRGGNWWDDPYNCTNSVRRSTPPNTIHHSMGFRPARNRLLSLDEIKYPVTRDWLEIEVPEALVNPHPDAKRVINVVVVNYLSSKDGTYVKQGKHFAVSNYDGSVVENLKIHELNKYMESIAIKGKFLIEEGSRFRDFNNSKAKPYIGINVLKYFNIYTEYPDTVNRDPNLNPDDANHPQWAPGVFDVFEKIGLKDLVEKNDVKQVWFGSKLAQPESAMSTPLGDSGYAANGHIKMPIYNKTYTFQSLWVHREVGEFIHCFGHQYEAQLSKVDSKFFWQDFVGSARPDSPQSFSKINAEGIKEELSDFQGWRISTGLQTEEAYRDYFDNWHENQGKPTTIWLSNQFKYTKSGCVHFPPNANGDYQWGSNTLVLSTIKNWSPDNTKANATLINKALWDFKIEINKSDLPIVNQCDRWITDSNNNFIEDLQSTWLVTWFQTIPSDKPIIFNRIGGMASQVENWWDIIFDWDETIKSGKKLFKTGLIQTISPFVPISNKSYGANPFIVVVPKSTSNLPVELSIKSGPAKISANNMVTITGPGTVVLAASQLGDSKYIAAEEVTTSFQVTAVKASQIIGVFSAIGAKAFGSAPFVITAPTASSKLPVTLSVKSGPATISANNTVTLTGVGTVVLAANQGGNASFKPAPEVTTSFTVNKGNQTLSFAEIPAKKFGDAPLQLSAAASSKLGVIYTSSSTKVATVSGNKVTIVGVGSAVITASQGGDSKWNAAAPLKRNLLVSKGDQQITFPKPADRTFVKNAKFVLAATVNSGLPVTFSSSNPNILSITGNTATILAKGKVTITASQPGNDNYNKANAVGREIIIK